MSPFHQLHSYHVSADQPMAEWATSIWGPGGTGCHHWDGMQGHRPSAPALAWLGTRLRGGGWSCAASLGVSSQPHSLSVREGRVLLSARWDHGRPQADAPQLLRPTWKQSCTKHQRRAQNQLAEEAKPKEERWWSSLLDCVRKRQVISISIHLLSHPMNVKYTETFRRYSLNSLNPRVCLTQAHIPFPPVSLDI